ncbi:MAG: hypothetical protein ACLFSI_08750 [Halorhodospira sp.]
MSEQDFERTYYYWAADQILEGGVLVRGVPISEEFPDREQAEAIREPIKELHPEARLVRAADLL